MDRKALSLNIFFGISGFVSVLHPGRQGVGTSQSSLLSEPSGPTPSPRGSERYAVTSRKDKPIPSTQSPARVGESNLGDRTSHVPFRTNVRLH